MSIPIGPGPVTAPPPPLAPSVRRTITIDGCRPGGVSGPVLLHGRARDLHFADQTSPSRVIAEATFQLAMASDVAYEIQHVMSDPPLDGIQGLLGTSARKGLRARVHDDLCAESPAERLVLTMLEDVPIAAGLSRLSHIHQAARATPVETPTRGRRRVGHPVDICAGWTADSVMRASAEAGASPLLHEGVRPSMPTASEDSWHWHPTESSLRNDYRRWRRIDVTRTADGDISLDCFFRDAYHDEAGVERIEHEYSVAAIIESITHTVRSCEATARVLPANDCSRAAPSAQLLVGSTLGDARVKARNELIGAHTCTHLSDTLVNLCSITDTFSWI